MMHLRVLFASVPVRSIVPRFGRATVAEVRCGAEVLDWRGKSRLCELDGDDVLADDEPVQARVMPVARLVREGPVGARRVMPVVRLVWEGSAQCVRVGQDLMDSV